MTNSQISSPSFPVRAARATLAVVVGIALGSSIATLNHSVNSISTVSAVTVTVPDATMFPLPACVTEDSRDCYWLATEFGNSVGRSFIDIGGETIYLDGLDK